MSDFEALNQLARKYEEEGNEEMAYRCYLENAMTEADGEALMQLGSRYLFGEYVNEDYDKAGHYFELAYEAGQKLPGSAFIIIGSCKAKQKEKPELVMPWYHLAVENGCEYGYECLGEIYMEEGEYQKAMECFLKPETKNTASLYNLGKIYDEGLGVERDIETAIEYYKRTIIDCWPVRDHGDVDYEKAENRLRELGIEPDLLVGSEE